MTFSFFGFFLWFTLSRISSKLNAISLRNLFYCPLSVFITLPSCNEKFSTDVVWKLSKFKLSQILTISDLSRYVILSILKLSSYILCMPMWDHGLRFLKLSMLLSLWLFSVRSP
jgi:hypothetical protein